MIAHRKLNQIITILLCSVFFICFFQMTASADTGPKPSVRILFKNMGNELCYGTLLSKTASSGPATVWDGNYSNAQHNGNKNYSYKTLDYEIWKAFIEYNDTNGYYFLQEGWLVCESKEIAWTYYPPNSFKILLYYPETQTFVVSGIYEKYAFDTYYTVDISSVEYNEKSSTDEDIEAYRSYNYTEERLSLLARIIITILIEIAIALFFGFTTKKQLWLLIGVNTITQIILNILLNMINYNSGQLAFVMCYVLFEIIVFAFEAILYCICMKKLSEPPKRNWFYVLYALIANGVSFVGGMLIAQVVPGIF